jgi:dienelactone hydrolase
MQDIGDGLQAYVSSLSKQKPDIAVIHLSEIFGLPLVNNKFLADSITTAGFFLAFPVLFEGDAVPVDSMGSSGFNMTTWKERHPVDDVDSIVTATASAVAGKYGCENVGSIGYCFGGCYVARFLADGKGIDAGFIGHPSGLFEDELQAVSSPVSIAYACNCGCKIRNRLRRIC